MFPIQIRLTVGTQAELDRLTAFVAGNTEASIKAAPKLETAAAPVEKSKKDAPAKTAPSPATAASPAAAEPSTAKQEPQPSTEKAATANSAPERSVVSKAAVSLALKDKPKIIEILAGFDGAKGVKDLKDDQLAAAFEQINAALAG
jgi:hypothetical protein